MQSYEVLKEALNEVGVKSVAADMGLSASLLYKWCQAKDEEEDSGADNPLDRLLRLCNLTNSDEPAVWLCQQRDGFFVRNSAAEMVPGRKMLKVTQSILSEFSEMLAVVSESYEDDNQIDREEAARIRKEWEDLKSTAEGFVVACERGAFTSQADTD